MVELVHGRATAGLWVGSYSVGSTLAKILNLPLSCAVLLSTNAAPWYQENAPGLIRTIGALLFPIGLVMIVLSGADLFTSNIMVKYLSPFHIQHSLISISHSVVHDNRFPSSKNLHPRSGKVMDSIVLWKSRRHAVFHGVDYWM